VPAAAAGTKPFAGSRPGGADAAAMEQGGYPRSTAHSTHKHTVSPTALLVLPGAEAVCCAPLALAAAACACCNAVSAAVLMNDRPTYTYRSSTYSTTVRVQLYRYSAYYCSTVL
jgi:hypothetical protein